MTPAATTTTAAGTMPAAPLTVTDQPQYRPIGGGKFEPANKAAHEECARWNAWADAWNVRTAARSAAQ